MAYSLTTSSCSAAMSHCCHHLLYSPYSPFDHIPTPCSQYMFLDFATGSLGQFRGHAILAGEPNPRGITLKMMFSKSIFDRAWMLACGHTLSLTNLRTSSLDTLWLGRRTTQAPTTSPNVLLGTATAEASRMAGWVNMASSICPGEMFYG